MIREVNGFAQDLYWMRENRVEVREISEKMASLI